MSPRSHPYSPSAAAKTSASASAAVFTSESACAVASFSAASTSASASSPPARGTPGRPRLVASAGTLHQFFRPAAEVETPVGAADDTSDTEGLGRAFSASLASCEEDDLKRQKDLLVMAEAQEASLEASAAERRTRERREREAVKQGDLAPLIDLDAELMTSVLETHFEWLQDECNRSLLWRFLSLRKQATQWYGEPAASYFERTVRDFSGILGSDLVAAAKPWQGLSGFLDAQINLLEQELFSMPLPGRFVPVLFVGGDDAESASDTVILVND